MKLVKYNPLNDYVPSTFGGLIENMLNNTNRLGFYPDVDVVKNEDNIQLHVVAPGMTKGDFELNIDNNKLTISGERKFDETLNYQKRESLYGAFERSFNLADTIDQNKITAAYENGILLVTLPINKKKVEKKTIKIS